MRRLDGKVAVITGGASESSFVTGQAIVVDGGITAGRPWAANQAMGARIRALLGVRRQGGRRRPGPRRTRRP